MDIKETAKQILKATQLYTTNTLVVSLSKDNEEERQNGLNKMQEAEESLIATLQQFQQSIIEQCKN